MESSSPLPALQVFSPAICQYVNFEEVINVIVFEMID